LIASNLAGKGVPDGVRIARQLYTSNEGKQFNVRAFHDLLSQGVSIVVNSVDRWVPQIGQLSAAIEREMGIYTDVNAYLSFFKGGAFKPHWDFMDVLVVQVHRAARSSSDSAKCLVESQL
jgi:ribosomal protein L16 Arg81 hydroxylase